MYSWCAYVCIPAYDTMCLSNIITNNDSNTLSVILYTSSFNVTNPTIDGQPLGHRNIVIIFIMLKKGFRADSLSSPSLCKR